MGRTWARSKLWGTPLLQRAFSQRGVPKIAFLPPLRPHAKLNPAFRRSYAQSARQNSSHDNPSPPPPKLGFRGTVGVLFTLYVFLSFTIRFGYEPLRDYGFFDTIARGTIFQVIPTKKVRPAKGAEPKAGLYQPITQEKEIRLLVLEPGNPGDELKCRLVNAKLCWRTRFEALSYTWGDTSVTTPLDCSGYELDITLNLRDALTDLRYPYRQRVLWVDAVCINQTDNQEKARQITLMGEIYSRAWRVLIYLGKQDDSVRHAMRDIRWLDWKCMPLHIQRYQSRLGALGPIGNRIINLLPSMSPISEGEVGWEQVVNLLRRPWFQRTWIVQEAILAKRALVICGNESVSWFKLERVVSDLRLYSGFVGPVPSYETVTEAVNGVNMMRDARRDRYQFILDIRRVLAYFPLLRGSALQPLHEFSEMLDLLIESRTFKCANPRDKIFGILGVTHQDTRSEFVTPNYTLSTGDVYRNFVLWEVFCNKSLRVLGCMSDKSGSSLALPSWVPDFTRLNRQLGLSRHQSRSAFNASGNTEVQARLSEGGTVLHLKGRMVDKLHTVGRRSNDIPLVLYIPSSVDDRLDGPKAKRTWYLLLQRRQAWVAEAMDIWIAARGRLASSKPPFATAHETTRPDSVIAGKVYPADWETFWRALVCNKTERGQAAPRSLGTWVTAYTRLVTEGMSISQGFVDEWLQRAVVVEQAISLASFSRRFAGTEMGLVGWVPRGARRGDAVVIVYGSGVPFVLRQGKDGKYQLVGECYLQGLMYGEAMTPGTEKSEAEFALI